MAGACPFSIERYGDGERPLRGEGSCGGGGAPRDSAAPHLPSPCPQECRAKSRPGADCDSDHELLIAKFRLKLKKVGKTTRPGESGLVSRGSKELRCPFAINCSLPGFPVHHHLPELAQAHVHRVSDGSGTEQPLYVPVMLRRHD